MKGQSLASAGTSWSSSRCQAWDRDVGSSCPHSHWGGRHGDHRPRTQQDEPVCLGRQEQPWPPHHVHACPAQQPHTASVPSSRCLSPDAGATACGQPAERACPRPCLRPLSEGPSAQHSQPGLPPLAPELLGPWASSVHRPRACSQRRGRHLPCGQQLIQGPRPCLPLRAGTKRPQVPFHHPLQVRKAPTQGGEHGQAGGAGGRQDPRARGSAEGHCE